MLGVCKKSPPHRSSRHTEDPSPAMPRTGANKADAERATVRAAKKADLERAAEKADGEKANLDSTAEKADQEEADVERAAAAAGTQDEVKMAMASDAQDKDKKYATKDATPAADEDEERADMIRLLVQNPRRQSCRI